LPNKKIFVGNLPYEVDEAGLSKWFAEKGFPIASADIRVDPVTGQPRGFGFVDMDEKNVKRCVLSCNGQDLLGRTLVINEASALPGIRSGRPLFGAHPVKSGS